MWFVNHQLKTKEMISYFCDLLDKVAFIYEKEYPRGSIREGIATLRSYANIPEILDSTPEIQDFSDSMWHTIIEAEHMSPSFCIGKAIADFADSLVYINHSSINITNAFTSLFSVIDNHKEIKEWARNRLCEYLVGEA